MGKKKNKRRRAHFKRSKEKPPLRADRMVGKLIAESEKEIKGFRGFEK